MTLLFIDELKDFWYTVDYLGMLNGVFDEVFEDFVLPF